MSAHVCSLPGMAELSLSLDAFVRSFGINRRTPHAFFLGAGASVTSGIPSAEMCIWEWKRSIFLTKNPGLELQFQELTLQSVRDKVQRWLDAQGVYPPAGSSSEYGFYIETCFPIPDDRRKYFEEKIRLARPQSGYRLLCALAEAGAIDSVWTTNFDGLAARAAGEFNITPVEVGIDSSHRAMRPSAPGELLCASLHGDYRYDSLKNTPQDLRAQDAALRQALVSRVSVSPLVVCGYSGRDVSVMAALKEAVSTHGTGALHWCGFRGSRIPEPVRELLETARAAGRAAFYVETGGFDDLLRRLALHCSVEGDGAERVRAIAAAAPSGEVDLPREAFDVPNLPLGRLIKGNAFELACPPEVYAFELREWPQDGTWAWLDALTAGRGAVAVPLGGKILALGTLTDLRDVFGARIKGPVELVPITDKDLSIQDGAVSSLMRRALLRSIASSRGLETDGRSTLWTKKEARSEGPYRVFESAVVFLRRIGTKHFLVVKPSVRIEGADGQQVPEEVSRKLKLRILGYQHNAPFNQVMKRWRDRLFAADTSSFEFPPDRGSTFRFEIRRAPVFAAIGARNGTLSDRARAYAQHRGMLLVEPALVFADKRTGSLVREAYAIRGLVENRPYDFALTRAGVAGTIRVGVVCTKREERMAAAFLQGFHSRFAPGKYEADYLVDFPGFEGVFGVPIEVPAPGARAWQSYAEPSLGADARSGVSDLTRAITRAIDAVHAACAPNVVVAFIPTRFERWERFESDNERIDLHDFVKAYCVQKGIATQFLRQRTVENQQECRVWWWLSVAAYAKSMRTPWVLDALDGGTAFVGLGFSLDPIAVRGEHVVLGCSHIYNPRGEGLQYRLTKVEDPIIRGKNCFLSEPDARRVGETVRQLFYESKFELPSRVVIHKRTPFLKSEIAGLRRGLDGVREIELLEINADDALRYVSSVPRPDGSFAEDNFPVERGTVVQLADWEALLWVHGASSAVAPRRKYYQGKRRIPAPLLLRRHAGISDLSKLAAEILGLSKMNWNTGDFYTKLPSTVVSSNQIAKIGSLLDRFGAVPYDYRLFI